MSRVTENEVALAVLQIAASKANLICTFDDARADVPKYVNLSADDLEESVTRPGEPMWHQQIRNIQSHHADEGNFINDGLLEHVPNTGYKATTAGLDHLKHSGLI